MSDDHTKPSHTPRPQAEVKAERRVAHPPRPIKRPVDRKALRESIFKRFDKVIARLAE